MKKWARRLKVKLFLNVKTTLETSGEDVKTTLETSGEVVKTKLEMSGEDVKTTSQTSGEDLKTTLETSGEDRTQNQLVHSFVVFFDLFQYVYNFI